ncbi:hypothetical protein NPIL_380141 [Nephila pilipes]|uniref:Uncharacterized protein n=1 Tax=Nephila pilipes TaxID=299642 RepID=A0A8X6QA40_NEPPI|nr:hypothetical protein NPIL_380141 [Nephila pilipes]
MFRFLQDMLRDLPYSPSMNSLSPLNEVRIVAKTNGSVKGSRSVLFSLRLHIEVLSLCDEPYSERSHALDDEALQAAFEEDSILTCDELAKQLNVFDKTGGWSKVFLPSRSMMFLTTPVTYGLVLS